MTTRERRISGIRLEFWLIGIALAILFLPWLFMLPLGAIAGMTGDKTAEFLATVIFRGWIIAMGVALALLLTGLFTMLSRKLGGK